METTRKCLETIASYAAMHGDAKVFRWYEAAKAELAALEAERDELKAQGEAAEGEARAAAEAMAEIAIVLLGDKAGELGEASSTLPVLVARCKAERDELARKFHDTETRAASAEMRLSEAHEAGRCKDTANMLLESERDEWKAKAEKMLAQAEHFEVQAMALEKERETAWNEAIEAVAEALGPELAAGYCIRLLKREVGT